MLMMLKTIDTRQRFSPQAVLLFPKCHFVLLYKHAKLMMFFPRNQYVKTQWWMGRFGQHGKAVTVGGTEEKTSKSAAFKWHLEQIIMINMLFCFTRDCTLPNDVQWQWQVIKTTNTLLLCIANGSPQGKSSEFQILLPCSFFIKKNACGEVYFKQLCT